MAIRIISCEKWSLGFLQGKIKQTPYLYIDITLRPFLGSDTILTPLTFNFCLQGHSVCLFDVNQ